MRKSSTHDVEFEFDAEWYLQTYPDVLISGMDPREHFMKVGFRLGRRPSPKYDPGQVFDRPLAAAHDFPGSRPHSRVATVSAGDEARGKLPINVLVISWDVGHNPVGRAYMLAEALQRVARHVVIAGFQFPKYGDQVWEPIRNSRLPVIPLPGENIPEFLDRVEGIAKRVRPDVVVACKPRLPSVLLASRIRERTGCRMIIDIDDHELSFFPEGEAFPVELLQKLRAGDLAKEAEPFGEKWTRLAHEMLWIADDIWVSNIALQKEFGGLLVPHVRDETVFDPKLHDKSKSREKYGIDSDDKIVMFFGTPRIHKGIDVIAKAVNAIKDPRFKLLIIGTSTDKSVTNQIESYAPGRVISLPNQPFDAIPEIISMADVICLPQDVEHPISKYQLPAKAIDAVAMDIPLLVSSTPPLMQLVNDGVAEVIDAENLSGQIEAAASRPETVRSSERRMRFLEKYSYRSAAEAFRNSLISIGGTAGKRATSELVSKLCRTAVSKPRARTSGGKRKDIVLFWKQNDTGLYGRRHDMVVKYLAGRDDVGKVIVVDAPISQWELDRLRDNADSARQDRFIYMRAYQKYFGCLDSEKVSYNVFIHPPGVFSVSEEDQSKPQLSQGLARYLDEVFAREGVVASEAIFWVYPKNYHVEKLIDYFQPSKVVVDVVDDHRAWPNVSEKEKTRLTRHYRDLLEKADMAFVNCLPMQESMCEFKRDIRLVPNGCDLTPPQQPPRNKEVYEKFFSWKGKKIGYVGNLEKKIDTELLEKIASCFPDVQLTLLGSAHSNTEVKRLLKYPNVLMPGVVPYDELGSWLKKFDVGLVPHRPIEMTRFMNPLKIYTYLSYGIPVVSTEVENIDQSLPVLRTVKDGGAFIRELHRIIYEGFEVDEGELESAKRENSWEARLQSHVDELMASHDDLIRSRAEP